MLAGQAAFTLDSAQWQSAQRCHAREKTGLSGVKKEMAITNLEKYRKDLDDLITEGGQVQNSLYKEVSALQSGGEQTYYDAVLKRLKGNGEEAKKFIEGIKPFRGAYQIWYSEALVLIKQLLPDRMGDFVRLYEKPKSRKNIDFESYRIEDACQGLRTSRGGSTIADISAALPLLESQIAIVKSIKRRFESSLFDIKQLVQADLFDSELGAARELLKNKFTRGAGAIAGVVLEGHLGQVCANHTVKLTKKHPSISDYNQALKDADVIDTAQWRFHQHLGDIRNKCDHSKIDEPTVDEVKDLIDGVAKVIKTVC